MLVLWGFSQQASLAQGINPSATDETRQNGSRQEAWLNIWSRVQKIRLERMQAELQLSKETMSQFAPKLDQIDQKKRAIGKERLVLLRKLRHLSESKASDTLLQDTLARIEANQAALEALKEENKTLIKAHLTPEQRAKYLFFQRKFNEELQDIIEKEKRRP
jgi:hypothetical protein